MINKDNIPKHIAIIMDGNGRWAQERHLPRTAGHHAGIDRVKEIVKTAGELGVRVLTLFAFSAENWTRPKKEIDMLMRSLNSFLSRQISELNKKNIKLIVIGSKEPMPKYLQNKIKEAQDRTKYNTGLIVVLALNYGARQEIVDAVKKFSQEAVDGKVSIEDLDINKFNQYFYTIGLPDPDLLIRTSGEMRISNFLLWQLSYAELYFAKKYWPDFKKQDLEKAICVYQKRERRFGGINVEKKDN
ncbi:MAG: isoprenyl transferase [Candidatus Omnitrophica bacterium]|nr:isoprenyl transferase [Candidatus Omnitrophota bacterium]